MGEQKLQLNLHTVYQTYTFSSGYWYYSNHLVSNGVLQCSTVHVDFRGMG